MEASPPFRVNVFRNSAAKSREGGKVIVLNETTPWAEFLQKAAYKLELPHIAKKVFNSDGGELSEVEEMLPGDILFISLGEPFGQDAQIVLAAELPATNGDSNEFLEQQRLAFERFQLAAQEKQKREKEKEEERKKVEGEELALRLMQEEQRRLNEEAEARIFECEICFGDMTASTMYIIDECFHKFCTDCMEQYIEVQLKNGGVLERADYAVHKTAPHVLEIVKEEKKGIKCPAKDCKHILQHDEIRNCASEKMFSTFDTMLLDKFLESTNDIKWCPRKECGGIILQSPRNPKLAVCVNPKCTYTWCFDCGAEYHDDKQQDCKMYQLFMLQKTNSDLLFYDWAKATDARGCPNCHAIIEKDGGCDHMVCSQCRHDFSWDSTELSWYTVGANRGKYEFMQRTMVHQKKKRRKAARRKGLI